LDRQRKLLAQNAGSASESDRAEAQYTNFLSQFNVAMSDARLAEQNVSGTRLTLEAEKANANAVRLRLDQLVQAELPRVTEVAREARLAADSMVGDEHTLVAKARAQLEAAEFDLEQTTVRAPAKGHVAFLSLRPGQRVASLPMRSWMAFIDHEKTEIVVSINHSRSVMSNPIRTLR
jgi:multidrug resistance efflux pump